MGRLVRRSPECTGCRQTELLQVALAARAAGILAHLWKTGNRIAARIEIMAMTTSSSIRVNARERPGGGHGTRRRRRGDAPETWRDMRCILLPVARRQRNRKTAIPPRPSAGILAERRRPKDSASSQLRDSAGLVLPVTGKTHRTSPFKRALTATHRRHGHDEVVWGSIAGTARRSQAPGDGKGDAAASPATQPVLHAACRL